MRNKKVDKLKHLNKRINWELIFLTFNEGNWHQEFIRILERSR